MALFRYASKLKKDKHDYLYKWDFTKSLVDEIEGATAEFRTAEGTYAYRDSDGAHIKHNERDLYLLSDFDPTGKTIEVDFGELNFRGDASNTVKIISNWETESYDAFGVGLLQYTPSNGVFKAYAYDSENAGTGNRGNKNYSYTDDLDVISNSTVKVVCKRGTIELYIDDDLKGVANGWVNNATNHHIKAISIGGQYILTSKTIKGNFYDITIKAVRIYENEEV